MTSGKTSPLWLTNGTEDDALQYSFNIVLQKLLPEFVLYMGNHEMFGELGANFTRKTYDDIKINHPLPVSDQNAFIINNAVKMIYPSIKKAQEERFGLFNLTGLQSREAQYCPITSIADNQPLCSVTTTKMANGETYPRTHQYDLEMGVEAEDAIGQTYSYVIEMTRIGAARDSYYISAFLSMPGQPSIMIGDKAEKNDLKGSPLGAVTTYFSLLKSMNKKIQGLFTDTGVRGRSGGPREILQVIFLEKIWK